MVFDISSYWKLLQQKSMSANDLARDKQSLHIAWITIKLFQDMASALQFFLYFFCHPQPFLPPAQWPPPKIRTEWRQALFILRRDKFTKATPAQWEIVVGKEVHVSKRVPSSLKKLCHEANFEQNSRMNKGN